MDEVKTAARQPIFRHAQIVKLERLIDFDYTPAEIAGEIGVTSDRIYRVYLPAGAPFRKDEHDQIRILGPAFKEWVYTCIGKAKREKHALGPDEAWCLKCNQVTRILQPGRKEINRYRALIQGLCEHCGTRVNRAIAAGDDISENNRQSKISTTSKDGEGVLNQSYLAGQEPRKGKILRKNYELVQNYLGYQSDEAQNSPKTIKRYWAALRHLIEWAEQTPFADVITKRPSFPVYLRTARNNGIEGTLAPATMEKSFRVVRAFFRYEKETYPELFRKIGINWLKSLQPAKAYSSESRLKSNAYYPLEHVRKLAAIQTDSLTLERDQAAACFLFLTGMRVDAFVSLPIGCVDLENWKVHQDPGRGVRTKNHKAAVTDFLKIRDLMNVVQAWDAKVRAAFPETAPWYARVNQNSDGFMRNVSPGISMAEQFAKGLKRLCEAAGVKYETPHKLRHGFAVYGLLKARTMGQMKAVSQSLMHKSLYITDSIYAMMVSDQVKEAIDSLTEEQAETPAPKEVWIQKLTERINHQDAVNLELMEKMNVLLSKFQST